MSSKTSDRRVRRLPASGFRVGLLIPVSGSMGMFGPSAYACAQMACETWNELGGVEGQPLHLTVLDSAESNAHLGVQIDELLDNGDLNALVALSTTTVCSAVSEVVSARIPLIFTTQFEGEGLPSWVRTIGETPDRQLLPAIDWMIAHHSARRWYLIGNDYCWPRRSHAAAALRIAQHGARVVGERYVPLGEQSFDATVREIAELRPDVVLVSLIGSDAVHMGRAFGRAGLPRNVLRLSVSTEENALLGMGADNTYGMYAASGYFAALPSRANGAFRERFHARFGDRAPALNSLAQSVYEGFVHLRGDLGLSGGDRGAMRSVRKETEAHGSDPMFIAQAEGLGLRVLEPLAAALR
jgi:ABC-type branched-subunit amino acid transport system substrate-binding protein